MTATYAGPTPTRRYRDLMRKLADEAGREYGWKTAVAVRLGVSASYVSKLSNNPTMSVGLDAVERARERFHLGCFFETEDDALAARLLRGDVAETGDVEVRLMAELAALNEGTRARVIRWAWARWGA